jgi:hypothetical protein
MSVSTRIYLPNDVEARTLGAVMAVLAGNKFERDKFGSVRPEGLDIEGVKSIPGLSRLPLATMLSMKPIGLCIIMTVEMQDTGSWHPLPLRFGLQWVESFVASLVAT